MIFTLIQKENLIPLKKFHNSVAYSKIQDGLGVNAVHVYNNGVFQFDYQDAVYVEGMDFSVYTTVYYIDGAKVDAAKNDTVFVMILARLTGSDYPVFRMMTGASLENGKLSFSFDTSNFYSSDDGTCTNFLLIELDKNSFEWNSVTDIELTFESALFKFAIRRFGTLVRVAGSDIELLALLGDNMPWSDIVPECSFDYSLEITEVELIGHEGGELYRPVYENGEKRTLNYDSAQGILVDGERSLVLTEEQKKLFVKN